MMRDVLTIFLPEKIGTYYALPKRVLGIDITKTNIYATQVHCAGNTIVLEKFVSHHLDAAIPAYADRVAQGLKTIFPQFDSYDELHSSLNSSLVIFKELTLPFLEYDKIAAVLSYEIESTLPFSLNDAIIDFIITKQNVKEKKSIVMVAAVMKQYVAEHLNYFKLANSEPTTLTVDLFDLYNLFRAIPEYASMPGGTALIDIGIQTTRIAYLSEGQLRLIRTINKGMAHIAKVVGTALNISNGQALEEILRFGFEKNKDTAYKTAVQNSFIDFWREAQFTFQSFLAQLGSDYTINQVLLLGEGAALSDIEQFIEKQLQVPCHLFDINALLKNATISLKQGARIDRAYTASIGTALSEIYQPLFNLRKHEFSIPTTTQFSKQFFVSIGLIVLILFALFMHTFFQTRKLQQAARSIELEAVMALRERGLTEERDLTRALEDAQAKVDREEELWFAFSRLRRFSFVKALQDLSTVVDRKSLGLNLKRLLITENTIGLEGEVKGYDELKILERELNESNLFSMVPKLQELKFNIRLPLKKNGGETGT